MGEERMAEGFFSEQLKVRGPGPARGGRSGTFRGSSGRGTGISKGKTVDFLNYLLEGDRQEGQARRRGGGEFMRGTRTGDGNQQEKGGGTYWRAS